MIGESLRAEGHFRRALEQNPRYAEAHLNLSILLSERGAYDESRQHLQFFNDLTAEAGQQPPAAALDELARQHVDLALRYRAYGMLSQAEEQIRNALELRPEYQDLRLHLAEILFERSMLVASGALVDEILQQRPQYDAAHLLRARIDKERGDWPQAREALSRVRRGAAAIQARTLARTLRENGKSAHPATRASSHPRTEA
jgi:Tfp pilus assembly protein PilF